VSSRLRAWQLPMQWPEAVADPLAAGRRAAQAERVLKGAIVFALLALTGLDRFGLRVTADYSIPPGMMALYALAAAMLLAGAARLHPRGALAYVALVTVASLSLLVNGSAEAAGPLSLTSFLLLVVLYAPFAVSLVPGAVAPQLWRWALEAYIGFILLVAIAGIVQFFAQFALRPPDWLFNYMPLIPERLRASGGWNTVIPAGDWIKSNGFFLREPSLFSIAMAFGIVCELSLRMRKWLIAMLTLALLLTYSGSGLVCLGAAMLFPLGPRTALRVLAIIAIGAAIYLVLGDALNLSFTMNRVDEFTSDRSSAYCRFIYPSALVAQHLGSSPWAALLGHGPGTMPKLDATCADGVETTYAKALFEYGFAGALAFGALVLGALNRSAAPIRLRVALGVAWLLLGGNLLTSEFLLLIYLFSGMWPEGSAAAALARNGRAR
jgi:hypothetical protein